MHISLASLRWLLLLILLHPPSLTWSSWAWRHFWCRLYTQSYRCSCASLYVRCVNPKFLKLGSRWLRNGFLSYFDRFLLSISVITNTNLLFNTFNLVLYFDFWIQNNLGPVLSIAKDGVVHGDGLTSFRKMFMENLMGVGVVHKEELLELLHWFKYIIEN